MSLRQRPSAAVNRYHLRMQGILRRCPDSGVNVLDTFLMASAPSSRTGWCCGSRRRWTSARRVEGAAKATSGTCGFCGADRHKEARCEVQRRMRELYMRSSSSVREGAIAAGKDREEVLEAVARGSRGSRAQ